MHRRQQTKRISKVAPTACLGSPGLYHVFRDLDARLVLDVRNRTISTPSPAVWPISIQSVLIPSWGIMMISVRISNIFLGPEIRELQLLVRN